MTHLQREDLYGLETYAEVRSEFRARILAHKRDRKLAIGPNATLYFEDRLTIQYQIQEMLRVERIFEPPAIEDELAAYNPLIPDGTNLKATFMLEFPEIAARQAALARLVGIERRAWMRIEPGETVWAIADEDLDRSTDEKTSAVHFLRFELGADARRAAKAGAPIGVGIEHPDYDYEVASVPERIRSSLVADLD